MMSEKYNHLFGPVPSRRFGRSLGVDLMPYKTCSFDCIFCQLGQTTSKTIVRDEYVNTGEVLEELNEWMQSGGEADYITLSGSGEPTLHINFGEILNFIKQNSSIPSVLLTNGSTMYLPKVRVEASTADIVKISLSAWNGSSLGWINRPSPEIKFGEMVEGIQDFRKQYQGKLWVEVFLLKGINSELSNIQKISKILKDIRPDKIQLNTVVRPPAEEFAAPVSQEEMEKVCNVFSPRAEVIPDYKKNSQNPIHGDETHILSILQRRPCTAEQLAGCYNMNLNQVLKILGILIKDKKVCSIRENSYIYFKAN